MRAANANFRRFNRPVDLRLTLGFGGQREILPEVVAPPSSKTVSRSLSADMGANSQLFPSCRYDRRSTSHRQK